MVSYFSRMPMNKTYHIYLNDKCLFKCLNDEEFNIIWGRLYHSYVDNLSYEELEDTDNTESYMEHSY